MTSVPTLSDVARIAATLPEVTEVDRRGSRTWRVGAGGKATGTVFAWERPFTKADVRRFGTEPVPAGDILAVRVADQSEKEAVLAAGHAGVFTIEHFAGFNAVLVRLEAVEPDTLRAALVDAWCAMAPPALVSAHLSELQ